MNKQIRLTTICFTAALIFWVAAAATVTAQVAAGGNYSLDQAVIASGGGESTSGGTFKIEGSIGQPTAGTRSTNSPFTLKGGFWTAPDSAPTAATVSVGGKVLTADGRGIRNVVITLTKTTGETQRTVSGSLGYYRFTDVEVGEIYVFSIFSKRFIFAQTTQVRSIFENTDDINFIAEGK